MNFSMRQEMQLQCWMCGANVLGESIMEARMRSVLFGWARYGTCPNCGDVVNNKKKRSVRWKRAVDVWYEAKRKEYAAKGK